MVHCIAHGKKDTVAVMTVDGKKGQSLTGWVMEQDKTLKVRALQNIPLGHKIALANISKGEKVIKYGAAIGAATAPIKKGQHVHTQNLKTERW